VTTAADVSSHDVSIPSNKPDPVFEEFS
jgi:hypothetical protein